MAMVHQLIQGIINVLIRNVVVVVVVIRWLKPRHLSTFQSFLFLDPLDLTQAAYWGQSEEFTIG